MSAEENVAPATFNGVMISGTFGDLVDHRNVLRTALQRFELVPVDMQNYVTDPSDDVISSSLEMVRKGAAYIGLISHRCGQIPVGPRNPSGYSITRMELEEAQRLGRPTVIFVMGDEHPVKPAHVERDAANIEKLEDFRKRAKQGRICVTFNSLEKFKEEAPLAVAKLKESLDKRKPVVVDPPATEPETPGKTIPRPPKFHAEPAYLRSHEFVGRRAELETLDDWALPSDSHPMLLFEAIGGTGKSMLTWHWVNHHATANRDPEHAWAGRFWYSFYERGARLESFCRQALAYMTGPPLERFNKTKTPELSRQLLAELKARPWLIVFDGLERILVTYNRSDAAELSDEGAENPEDKIADRDPLAAIRPEDDELLKALSAAAPSKLLITSRLIPRALMNRADQAMPGVLHERLPGLRPADAEALLRSKSCGNITGDSGRIGSFLQQHCDCHPLVIGVLAGLIHQPGPWRGDFDAWEKAPDGGGTLNLADLNLIQKRNHILESALAILPEKSRALLATLVLLSEAADAELLLAFNPHDGEDAGAAQRLWNTVHDLEERGLLQYDAQVRRYNLHPVVRGIVAGGLPPDEIETHGERVVDYFSARSHNSGDEAESLDDVRDWIQVVRTYLRMGRRQAACDAFRGEFSNALLFNLEANAEVLALLDDFFPHGWDRLPEGLDRTYGNYLSSGAGIALDQIGQTDASLAAYSAALRDDLKREGWEGVRIGLSNIANNLVAQNRLAADHRILRLALELAESLDCKRHLFRARLDLFRSLVDLGNCSEAESLWAELDSMGRRWSRAVYRPGMAEVWHARFRLQRGDLTEDILTEAEHLAGDSARREAERLSEKGNPHNALALLWLEFGDDKEALQAAKLHALAAYTWAWADGEPFVRRYALTETRKILDRLGEPYPDLPPYDPAKDQEFDWEPDVRAAIERLRREKQGE